MSRLPARPALSRDRLADVLDARFGLRGVLSALPGERDLNLRLDAEDGSRWVVKVTSEEEPDALLEREVRLMERLAEERSLPVPRHRTDGDGNAVARIDEGIAGAAPLRVRVLEMLPGRPLAHVRPRSDALLRELGRTWGGLAEALAGAPDDPPRREAFDWSFDRAEAVIERGLAHADDPARRALLEASLAGFREVAAARAALPRGWIHGDGNDHNILVACPGSGGDRVTGILDFGDAHAAPAVDDLAVLVAYSVLGRADPVLAAARVVEGYHEVRTLSDDELAAVAPLARARLAMSVAMSAWRAADGGGEADPYLTVSEAPAWEALSAWDAVPPAVVTGLVREACGREPCRRAPAVRSWLAGQAGTVVPPVALPDGERPVVLDLAVASPLLDGHDTDDTEAFTRRVFGWMAERGASVGIGRYGEPRGFYLTDAFAGRPAEHPERRTVHLGVDVFAAPGTPVRAPLDGRVASVQDNADRLDYGPTVILEHDTPHGPLWTLYGHLSRASVEGLEPGTAVAAGGRIGEIGPFPENGDWPPHLHLQVVLDRMGLEGTFPGVAAPRERGAWMSFCPDPTPLLGLDALDARWREPDEDALLARRRAVIGGNVGLSYRTPIHVVRGRGAFLFDALGRAWLDCVNNVAHVGHEHPRVVEALARQARVLNTNTRYLHASVVRYAERLGALLPGDLSVCFFVNSGSEANELALRLARAHTGKRGVVALEGGYHGHTTSLVGLSHYKYAGAGGTGPDPWVRAVPLPEPGRTATGGDAPATADPVREAFAALAADGWPGGAFLAEALPSCAGQVVPPRGWLQEASRHARAAGAVCIADEVQTGFGRVGSHMWAFEAVGFAPDIVTLGKPIGNGHPLGAVVTTPDIARSFDDGMEFFSTFGGNPVSAEVGMAVLDVLEEEGLQAHADEVGRHLARGLEALAERHPCIADVRGRGLFLGVELVAAEAAGEPDGPGARAREHGTSRARAGRVAHHVVERLRDHGILGSRDGPDRNVLKIKPPLCFSAEHADRLCAVLDEVLHEDAVRGR